MDEDGNVKPGREEHLKAFIYFIDRILPSVNYEVNDYRPLARKNKRISKCYTATDEAFGLACVENYRQRWDRLCLKKESRRAARLGNLETADDEVPAHEQVPEWFYARWSGSHLGNTISGWTETGVDRYNEHCKMIAEKRAGKVTGADLEDYIKKHWKGTLKERTGRKPKRKLVVAYREDHAFNTKYAEV